MDDPSPKRCAVYTRKSSEEGLEQDFNSLHAQREACEAFIRSQAGEGWRLVKTAYDDGGFSGGSMERPALQRLLADIDHSLVDVVVVYKVDRLTRSLADFAKMVELFDAHGVSFVAVTQQFNTTTSMGRLTLNVLLSFAQFEREVTGERIRDKIAASKRKGMWMGGVPPLGYDVRERKLVVNETEAKTVRQIFARYLELGSVRPLKQDLDERAIVSKVRISRSGNHTGGKPFSRGALYKLLSNPIYLGEICHKSERHPGQHEPIVDRELWARVRRRLRDQSSRRRGEPRSTQQGARSSLAGKLFDENGEPFYVQATATNGRRYRYYVSRGLLKGSSDGAEQGRRVSAPELERTVSAAAQQVLADRAAIAQALDESGVEAIQLPSVFRAAQERIENLRSVTEAPSALAELTERVGLRRDGIQVSLRLPLPVGKDSDSATSARLALTRFVPVQMKRRGVEMRMVLGSGPARSRVDTPLLKAVARAWRWSDDLLSGRVRSLGEIAKRERVTGRYVRRLIPLGFLAPKIIEAIVEGHQPAELTAETLTKRLNLPLPWNAQEQVLHLP